MTRDEVWKQIYDRAMHFFTKTPGSTCDTYLANELGWVLGLLKNME